MLIIIDKLRNFAIYSLIYSLFNYLVYHFVGGSWRLALYSVGFFSFYATYFDSLVGRPLWMVLYFVMYLVAHLGVFYGFAKSAVYVVMVIMLLGPLLYGKGLGRLASLVFFWAGAFAGGVVINVLGRIYRLVVPYAYDILPTALPSPFDIPMYLLGYLILWHIHCVAKRWGGSVECPRWRLGSGDATPGLPTRRRLSL